ncbi:MAG: NAD(P)/FAD-dependent oxidoreductase [Thermoplasmatales archaeon]|nr:NAD(P)/FAD-dependent oxidoreductase [Thermoplasmatales archaeon]
MITREPGTAFVLNRQEFINQLGKNAEKLGVELCTDDKIKSTNDLDGDYIIDASGCPSSIKREIGIDKGIKAVSFQQTIENSNCFKPNEAVVKFDGRYGYFWIFPRNPEKKELNVGVGFIKDFGYNLKEFLEIFKKEYNITGNVNYVTGGLIPVGLQRPFKYKNILFVGDAGVGTFPFSGQGIYRALLSGDIAGKCISKGKAKKYPHMINQAFIKWEIVGKTFITFNLAFRRINPRLFLFSLRKLGSFVEITHL